MFLSLSLSLSLSISLSLARSLSLSLSFISFSLSLSFSLFSLSLSSLSLFSSRSRVNLFSAAAKALRARPESPNVRDSAEVFLERELAVRAPNTATIVMHSVFLQYPPVSVRQRIAELIEKAGLFVCLLFFFWGGGTHMCETKTFCFPRRRGFTHSPALLAPVRDGRYSRQCARQARVQVRAGPDFLPRGPAHEADSGGGAPPWNHHSLAHPERLAEALKQKFCFVFILLAFVFCFVLSQIRRNLD